MDLILEANQNLPYNLMKNKFLHGKRYKELLYIVNKNIPNISSNEIIEMFKSLGEQGCTCATLANIIFEQLYVDDESFKKVFGFSLYVAGTNKLDLNKILVDIYSKLYGVLRIRLVEHEEFSFNNVKEATKRLLSKEYDLDADGVLELFNNGFMSNGIDSEGKLLFVNNKPKINNYLGTCNQVAKEKFGINDVKNLDDLKKVCDLNNIELYYKDEKIYEKLSGILSDNFNFWSNYYLQKYGVNFSLNKEHINRSDYPSDYNDFVAFINNFISDGYSISVSVGVGKDVYMHTSKSMSWGKVSSEKAGHSMLFKHFSPNNDIVVSSYGEEYFIPKEYYMMLDFDKIKKHSNEVNKEDNMQKKI